jgi:hypothetical protein
MTRRGSDSDRSRILLALWSVLETSASREAEILMLRQQLLVLNCKRSCARLRNLDRMILLGLSTVPVAVRRYGHRKARDRPTLASARLSSLLVLEGPAVRR